MSANHQFACGAVSKEQAVLDAERMVKFAAEPVIPGELVKGQIRNASDALQLDFGTVRRAWYRLSGPEIYPTIYNAWAALIERRAKQINSPWRVDISQSRNSHAQMANALSEPNRTDGWAYQKRRARQGKSPKSANQKT